jgi:transposase
MGNIRKRHTPALKLKVAIEGAVGEKTVTEIASNHGVHPTQVSQWKKQLQEASGEIFDGKKNRTGATDVLVSQLYEEVGRLKFELDWVKKKAARFGRL